MMSEVKLPTCDQSLPSKWNKSETCTEAGLFEREDSKVRSKYHDCYCLGHSINRLVTDRKYKVMLLRLCFSAISKYYSL